MVIKQVLNLQHCFKKMEQAAKGQQALPYNARVSHAAETPQNKSQYDR